MAKRELKPCLPGKERNPETNRCKKVKKVTPKVKVSSSKKASVSTQKKASVPTPKKASTVTTKKAGEIKRKKPVKPCLPGKERDPLTNRCKKVKKVTTNVKVPTTKKTSVSTTKKASSSKKASVSTTKKTGEINGKKQVKPCLPGKERDPLTNRCKNVKKAPKTKKVKETKPPRVVKSQKVPRRLKGPDGPMLPQIKLPDANANLPSHLPSLSNPITSYIPLDIPMGKADDSDDSCMLTKTDFKELRPIFGVMKNEEGQEHCAYLNSFFQSKCFPDGIKIVSLVSIGADGYIFETRDKNKKRGILKLTTRIFQRRPDFAGDVPTTRHEIKMGKDFYRMGLGPKIHWQCAFYRKGATPADVYHMERVDGTLGSYIRAEKRSPEILQILVKQIFQLVKRLEKYGYTHGDFHPGNIVYKLYRNGVPNRLMILDGNRTIQNSSPKADISLFSWHILRGVREKNLDRETADILLGFIQKEAEDIYGIKFVFNHTLFTFGTLESEFWALYDLAHKNIPLPQHKPYTAFDSQGDEPNKEDYYHHGNHPFTRHDTQFTV